MAGHGNHLEVPGPSFAAINTSNGERDGSEGGGRSRSNSAQSSTSQIGVDLSNLGAGTDAVDYARQSSIRISHQPSRGSLRGNVVTPSRDEQSSSGGGYFGLRRNRANSLPSQPALSTTPGQPARQASYMPDIEETQVSPAQEAHGSKAEPAATGDDEQPETIRRRLRRARTNIHEKNTQTDSAEYEDQLVDFLDVVGRIDMLSWLSNKSNVV